MRPSHITRTLCTGHDFTACGKLCLKVGRGFIPGVRAIESTAAFRPCGMLSAISANDRPFSANCSAGPLKSVEEPGFRPCHSQLPKFICSAACRPSGTASAVLDKSTTTRSFACQAVTTAKPISIMGLPIAYNYPPFRHNEYAISEPRSTIYQTVNNRNNLCCPENKYPPPPLFRDEGICFSNNQPRFRFAASGKAAASAATTSASTAGVTSCPFAV